MMQSRIKVSAPKKKSVFIDKNKWIRAKYSGMFKGSVTFNTKVEKDDIIGNITDSYGKFNHFIKADNTGYIFNVNQSPLVYQGDALLHISTKVMSD